METTPDGRTERLCVGEEPPGGGAKEKNLRSHRPRWKRIGFPLVRIDFGSAAHTVHNNFAFILPLFANLLLKRVTIVTQQVTKENPTVIVVTFPLLAREQTQNEVCTSYTVGTCQDSFCGTM